MRINKSFYWKRWFFLKTRLDRIKVCLICLYFGTKKMSFFFLYFGTEGVPLCIYHLISNEMIQECSGKKKLPRSSYFELFL